MSAAISLRATATSALGPWAAPAVMLSFLGAIVAGRWLAVRAGGDGLVVGAAFGLLLAGLAAGAAARDHHPRPPTSRAAVGVAAGVGFGLLLVALTVIGPALAGVSSVPGLGRPAAPFGAWVMITVLVATAEEGVLRGVLLDRIGRAAGVVPAIVLTSVAFALMHVPLYGWQVVPLDFAVGLGLAGLRLTTRSLVAPATAHSVADLATWWL